MSSKDNKSLEALAAELVCIRLTDNIGKDRVSAVRYHYKSDFDGIGGRYCLSFKNAQARFTVHFSLNYCYTTYRPSGESASFDWTNRRYGVIIPLSSLLQSRQIPYNLHPADTFFLREVKFTPDTAIVEGPNIVEKVKEAICSKGFAYKRGTIRGWRGKEYAAAREKVKILAQELGISSTYHCQSFFEEYEELTSTLINWRAAIDWWGSDNPEVIKEYEGTQQKLRQARTRLLELCPQLTDNSMKRYARRVLQEAERNFHFG